MMINRSFDIYHYQLSKMHIGTSLIHLVCINIYSLLDVYVSEVVFVAQNYRLFGSN